MCDMLNCDAEPVGYVVTQAGRKNPSKRMQLCLEHVELANRLAEAQLTKIVDYGPLNTGPRRIK